MAFVLIVVTVLHLMTLALLFVATTEKSCWMWSQQENADLWHNCMFDNVTETWMCATSKDNEWLHAVQALMVLSVIFSSVAFLVFVAQLFVMSKGGLFYVTGLCQVFAGVTDFSAVLIYTLHHKEIVLDTREPGLEKYGYCFILAWVCVPLLLCSGVMYIHLRKKE